MRVIEEKMLEAIKNRKNFKLSNTRVEHGKFGFVVWLYQTPIFMREYEGQCWVCDGGWNTATTASRLRALGVLYHKNPAKNHVVMTPLSQARNIAKDVLG